MSVQQFCQRVLEDPTDRGGAVPSRGTEPAESARGTDQTTEERKQPFTSKLGDNAAIVRSFLELAFNGRQPTEAAATYLGAAYRQCHPGAYGSAAFIRLAEGYLRAFPELHLTLQLLLADGDVVVTQSLIQRHPNDRGQQVMDTFELADGRIVWHWDVMQELPENAARAALAA